MNRDAARAAKEQSGAAPHVVDVVTTQAVVARKVAVAKRSAASEMAA